MTLVHTLTEDYSQQRFLIPKETKEHLTADYILWALGFVEKKKEEGTANLWKV
jgi:hypothetical protein